MKKLTKIIAATGIVAGLGVAGLPLVGHAVQSHSDTVTVNIKVSDSISISASPKTINLGTLAPNSVTNITGDANKTTLTIKSNNFAGYDVTAAGGALTASGSGGATITYGTVAQGSSHWGISKTNGSFAGLTTSDKIQSKTSKSADAGDAVAIYFGASTSAVQTTGNYTGTIVFTATNK